LPLASALFYIFAYPYPSKFIYEFSLKKNKELMDSRNQIEQNQLLTREESQRAKIVHIREKQQLRDQIKELQLEIQAIHENTISVASDEKTILSTKEQETIANIEIDAIKLLSSLISQSDSENLIASADLPESRRYKALIGYLRSEGYLENYHNEAGNSAIRITDKGLLASIRKQA
jgi:DNA-binding transcriptional MerR regulator